MSQLVITRDPAHQYTVNGESWPGVTHILKATKLSSDWSTVPAQILEAARDRGHRVHEACWAMAASAPEFSWGDLDDAHFGYVQAFELYLKERGIVRMEAVEQFVAHPRLRYAGALDAVALLVDESRLLIDLKTGDPADAAGHIQTAAYAEAWNEMFPDAKITARECVKLNADGTYRLHPYTNNPTDFRVFGAALVTFRSHHPSWRTR